MLKYLNLYASDSNIEMNNISFEVKTGDYFTLFGPDNSGKTELIEMLMGIRRSYKGHILYDNMESKKLPFQVKKKIRYIPDDILIANNTTGDAYLKMVLKMYNMEWSNELEEILERFQIDLSEHLGEMTYEDNKLITVLAAVATNPELIILDEPSNFLTPKGVKKVYQLLDQMHQRGCTILVLAEHFEETAEYSNAFAYLKDGSILLTSHKEGTFNHYKAVTIQKGQWDMLEIELGRPIAESEKGKTYLYIEETGGLTDIFNKCCIESDGMYIEQMTMEEFIESDYTRWK